MLWQEDFTKQTSRNNVDDFFPQWSINDHKYSLHCMDETETNKVIQIIRHITLLIINSLNLLLSKSDKLSCTWFYNLQLVYVVRLHAKYKKPECFPIIMKIQDPELKIKHIFN